MSISADISKQLESARRELLELSTTNRLLDTPRDQEKGLSLEIKDELADQVFGLLVTEGKPMRFEQGEEVQATSATVEPPAEEEPPEEAEEKSKPKRKTISRKRVTKKKAASIAVSAKTQTAEERHSDNVLHTELAPEELDRRLLGLVTDATATKQEQGVNILYLAVGFLRWLDEDKTRQAPLLLIPVRLERQNASTRFNLLYTGEEIDTNLTLKTRVKINPGIHLPTVPDVEELVPSVYFAEVRKVIADQKGWEVLDNDMLLWFFSFTKLLMYRDLEPASWPESCPLAERPLLKALLRDGFTASPPLVGEGQRIDAVIDPVHATHVIDCDSSQTLVIAEACAGRSLVMQGPPGTGKSQTITNLIASAVHAGKTILFVAEKMAALQVVQRRLAKIGLGDVCLELHSDLTKNTVVLQEIDRVLQLGRPKDPSQMDKSLAKLTQVRDELDKHVDDMHTPLSPAGFTPYQILTELIALRSTSVAVPDFDLPDAPTWNSEQLKEKLALLRAYVAQTKELGPPAKHPWRGTSLGPTQPFDLQRLVAPAASVAQQLDDASNAARSLATRLGDDAPTTIDGIWRLIRSARSIQAAPPGHYPALCQPVWADHRATTLRLGESAAAVQLAHEKLQGVVKDSAWDVDVLAARDVYKKYGRSWFRMFRSGYRAARRTFRSLLLYRQPRKFAARMEIFDLLADRQKGMNEVTANQEVGRKAFDPLWDGKNSDWRQIHLFTDWTAQVTGSDLSPRTLECRGKLDKSANITTEIENAENKLLAFLRAFQQLAATLKFDLESGFSDAGSSPTFTNAMAGQTVAVREETQQLSALLESTQPLLRNKLDELRARIASWQSTPEGLAIWQRYGQLREQVGQLASGALLRRLDTGEVALADGPCVLTFAYLEALYRHTLKERPQLAAFDGPSFERLIEEFRQLDEERLTLARVQIAREHYRGLCRQHDKAFYEEAGILRHEMQKKRRQIPLRQLLEQGGRAIQAVKPVFMMSPLSVAQDLTPGKLEFDILLIDEASQVRPVEALGAAARCKQMVIVGDDKQMPPTTFFGSVVGDIAAEDEDDSSMQAGDVESILSLCLANSMPQRRLRWHYRSKHPSLIAVSNREFYDNQLCVVPSPQRESELGLKFRFIEGGKFTSRCNPVEAQAVAQAVMEHAAKHPKWTLGVAAFSMPQRDAILHEVERLRRDALSLESFFDPERADPFFVKNLENVQGDERDVIFVSVGYGPDERGRVSLNFGPVSASGGERRLNVLMTRAKMKCVIFSSIHAEDIDLSRATGRGPAVFRAFLQYAQSGAQVSIPSGSADPDRLPLLIQAELARKGIQSQAHVGLAGVFVDLAIIDPDDPGRYILGLECDGLDYRDASSARDRDRLREQVMMSQGWKILHVWCWDWFNRPTEQLQKILDAIEEARKQRKTEQTDETQEKPGIDLFKIERYEATGDLLTPSVPPEPPPIVTEKAPETPSGNETPPSAGGSSFGKVVRAAVRVAEAGMRGGKNEAIEEVVKIIQDKR